MTDGFVLSIAAGVLGNISTEILKHSTRPIHDTIVGKMLSRFGFLEPDLEQQLRDVLSKTLEELFRLNTHYQVSGIISFFKDPKVAKQIADYLVDGNPMNPEELRGLLDKHLETKPVSRIVMTEHHITSEALINNFIGCYRRTLRKKLTLPQLAFLSAWAELNSETVLEMKKSDERFNHVFQEIAERIDDQNKILTHIGVEKSKIKEYLFSDHTDSLLLGDQTRLLQFDPKDPGGAFKFDVFFAHNKKDLQAVEEIASRLFSDNVNIWLDKWNLIPGEPWQEVIEEALDLCRTFAIFLGPAGIGPWQNLEMRSSLETFVHHRSRRVIPVLLPGAPDPVTNPLPRFLRLLTWVDFRGGINDPISYRALMSGIFGIAPGSFHQ